MLRITESLQNRPDIVEAGLCSWDFMAKPVQVVEAFRVAHFGTVGACPC